MLLSPNALSVKLMAPVSPSALIATLTVMPANPAGLRASPIGLPTMARAIARQVKLRPRTTHFRLPGPALRLSERSRVSSS